MIEAPLSLQETASLPSGHLVACKAAGNTKHFLDLDGKNGAIAPLPAGFTPRGIVALLLSCVAAVMVMVLIGL